MGNTLLVGAQWGDEGKGKIVDYLSKDAKVVVRYQGGSNAGHTIEVGSERYVLHLVPSGAVRVAEGVISVQGNGMVIYPPEQVSEIKKLVSQGLSINPQNLLLSDRARMTLKYHRTLDAIASGGIGSTKRGIGQSYEDKANRERSIMFGELRDMDALKKKVGDNVRFYNHILSYPDYVALGAKPLTFEEVWQDIVSTRDEIFPFIREDIIDFLLAHDGEICFEGAQGTMLDTDHGTVPGVSSSNTTVGGVYTGTGVNLPITRIRGIVKAYTTRVGEGEFPTELGGVESAVWCKTKTSADEIAAYPNPSINSLNDLERGIALRRRGRELGASTGRPRRCGWEDAMVVVYARKVNGITDFCLTKLDTLDTMERIKVCVGYELDGKTVPYFPISRLREVKPIYEEHEGWVKDTSEVRSFEDLPYKAQSYVLRLQELFGSEISLLGVGPGREQIITG